LVDLERAAAYVEAHGDALERGRLHTLLGNGPPPAEAVEALQHGQQPDGGWPAFWSGEESSLDATCFRIDQAEDLGAPAAELVERGLRFITARQQDDGGWEEDAALASAAPAWARPGDERSRLYLTANCAFWLGRYGRPGAQRAAGLLVSRIAADGSLPTFLQAHWLAAAALRAVGRESSARTVAGVIARRIGELGAGALAWLANALPSDEVGVEARDRLSGLQEADGRWQSEDGDAFDVAVTLAAMRVLAEPSA
jgi:hypothetical protein